MRIYTRTGDDGHTSLWRQSGMPRRVSKADLRVEAYGAVDETNAALGLAKALLDDAFAQERDLLNRLQVALFDVGAELATPDLTPEGHRVSDDDVAGLEAQIDRIDGDLPRLRSFILPDGAAAGAALHVARTAARRSERACVRLAAHLGEDEQLNPATARYLNRLSDLLFVLARAVNRRSGQPETAVRPPDGGDGAK